MDSQWNKLKLGNSCSCWWCFQDTALRLGNTDSVSLGHQEPWKIPSKKAVINPRHHLRRSGHQGSSPWMFQSMEYQSYHQMFSTSMAGWTCLPGEAWKTPRAKPAFSTQSEEQRRRKAGQGRWYKDQLKAMEIWHSTIQLENIWWDNMGRICHQGMTKSEIKIRNNKYEKKAMRRLKQDFRYQWGKVHALCMEKNCLSRTLLKMKASWIMTKRIANDDDL